VHSSASILAGTSGSLRPPVIEIGLPSRRPYGRDIAKHSSTVPDGGDEPRLFMPWLGRANAFFTDLDRLALTNEANPMARSAGPRRGFPHVGAGSTAAPLTVSTV
jgi:hypothetical protein